MSQHESPLNQGDHSLPYCRDLRVSSSFCQSTVSHPQSKRAAERSEDLDYLSCGHFEGITKFIMTTGDISLSKESSWFQYYIDIGYGESLLPVLKESLKAHVEEFSRKKVNQFK